MAHLKTKKLTKLLSILLALIFMLGTFACCGKNDVEETTAEPTTVGTTAPPPVYRNPLTGEEGYDKTLLNNRPVLVSVENHPDARPQWGLTSSDIVWEMVAEGGITRMLLMYADVSRMPDKLGPTRSARHYFVELAGGFDAIFVHFGGSTYAYNYIKKYNVDDIDGMSAGSAFFRDKSRGVATEHTAYTTKDAITKHIADKEMRTELKDGYDSPFKFNKSTKALTGGNCNEITVSFSSGYTYKYTFESAKGVYLSTLNGNKFVDSDGTQQNFENIIVCYTTISSMNDSKGRVTFDLSSGKGVYVSNGTYQNITWEKGDYSDMMKFYDEDGNELSLNPGRSYIAICDKSRESYNTIA